jgi:post-segregation antitoxin (ccd killing protein)
MATNLAIDPKLIEETLRVSGARTKKAAVTQALQEFIARKWVEENRTNIDAYNEEIAQRGVWSENMRSW